MSLVTSKQSPWGSFVTKFTSSFPIDTLIDSHAPPQFSNTNIDFRRRQHDANESLANIHHHGGKRRKNWRNREVTKDNTKNDVVIYLSSLNLMFKVTFLMMSIPASSSCLVNTIYLFSWCLSLMKNNNHNRWPLLQYKVIPYLKTT